LPEETRDDFEQLKAAVLKRYGPNDSIKWKRTVALYSKQKGDTRVEDFMAEMLSETSKLGLDEEQTKPIILNGLRPDICQFMKQQKPKNLQDIQKTAQLAQETCVN